VYRFISKYARLLIYGVCATIRYGKYVSNENSPAAAKAPITLQTAESIIADTAQPILMNTDGNNNYKGWIDEIKIDRSKGTADISATIKGRSVKIEVKIGKDRQSEAQKQYQAKVEQSGGIYFIAKDFSAFMDFYVSLTA